MLNACKGCGAIIVAGGVTRAGDRFCNHACLNFHLSKGFCERCVEETLPQSAGNLWTFNGIGVTMYGDSRLCADCGSAIRRVWFVVFYIPLIPLTRFRVIDSGGGRKFYSRKVRGTRS